MTTTNSFASFALMAFIAIALIVFGNFVYGTAAATDTSFLSEKQSEIAEGQARLDASLDRLANR